MIQDTKVISIKDLLPNSNLNIPIYQRPYKWTVKNVNQLIDDILVASNAKKTSYRLGTIVLHKNDNQFDIVDGQQRLITLSLLAYAITKYKNDVLKEMKDFNSSMMNLTFTNDISKYNIKNNYKEVERRIGDFNENSLSFFFFNCEMVIITLSDEELPTRALSESFQFFDSQNTRGKELEPHDLLKAFHLREMTESSESEEIAVINAWESIETNELSKLFSKYLFKIRNWSSGKPARDFTKMRLMYLKE